jgi:hypothetical protein
MSEDGALIHRAAPVRWGRYLGFAACVVSALIIAEQAGLSHWVAESMGDDALVGALSPEVARSGALSGVEP